MKTTIAFFGIDNANSERFRSAIEIAMKDKEIAERLWNLEEINGKYQKVLRDFEINGNKALLRERFLEVASSDPNLPLDLLPDDWVGSYVEKKALSG